MALDKNVSYTGQKNVSTFNGKIRIDDIRGFVGIADENNVVRSRLDLLGLTTVDPDGTERLRAGIARSDGRSGFWDTKPGIDLRDEGL